MTDGIFKKLFAGNPAEAEQTRERKKHVEAMKSLHDAIRINMKRWDDYNQVQRNYFKPSMQESAHDVARSVLTALEMYYVNRDASSLELNALKSALSADVGDVGAFYDDVDVKLNDYILSL